MESYVLSVLLSPLPQGWHSQTPEVAHWQTERARVDVAVGVRGVVRGERGVVEEVGGMGRGGEMRRGKGSARQVRQRRRWRWWRRIGAGGLVAQFCLRRQ